MHSNVKMDTHEIIERGQARRRLRSEPSFARLVRERSGLTQSELAQLVGVDRSAVSRWETGRRIPGPRVIDRYAEILKRLEIQA